MWWDAGSLGYGEQRVKWEVIVALSTYSSPGRGRQPECCVFCKMSAKSTAKVAAEAPFPALSMLLLTSHSRLAAARAAAKCL